MTSHAENTKRIAKNTLMLYIRMLFSMLVSLYTSRVVLNTLGVEDYGIYNVVGGLVTMFSLISNSLSASVSRFLTFELGLERDFFHFLIDSCRISWSDIHFGGKHWCMVFKYTNDDSRRTALCC